MSYFVAILLDPTFNIERPLYIAFGVEISCTKKLVL